MLRRRKTPPSQPSEVGFDPEAFEASMEAAIEQAGLRLAATIVQCVREGRERARADTGVVSEAERIVRTEAMRRHESR